MLVTPDNVFLPYSFLLGKGCPKNTVAYEMVIARLELALHIPIIDLKICGVWNS